jgi:hypothetical protein
MFSVSPISRLLLGRDPAQDIFFAWLTVDGWRSVSVFCIIRSISAARPGIHGHIR